MEEVDNIILNSMRECGCDFTEDVKSLAEFTTENVVEATVRCLRIINTDLKMSHSLPPGMSARFRIGTALAQACQAVGYRGDIGYQTFLYSSEADIRRLFMFLVEKMPRKKDEAVEQPSGKDSVLKRNIARVLKCQLSSPWLPAYCKKHGVRRSGGDYFIEGARGTFAFTTDQLTFPESVGSGNVSAELLEYYRRKLPYMHEQLNHHNNMIPSLLEKNSLDLSLHQQWEGKLNKTETKATEEHSVTELEKRLRRIAAKNSSRRGGAGGEILIGGISANSSFHEVISLISDQTSTAESLTSAPVEGKVDASKGESVKKLQENNKIVTPKKLAETMDAGAIIENHVGEETAANDIAAKMAPTETEEEMIQRVEKDLKGELIEVVRKMEKMESEIRRFNDYIDQGKDDLTACKESNTAVQEKVKLQKKTLSLLPNADENIKKLETMIEANEKRMVSLSQQWDKHRIPLMEQYETLKEQTSTQQSQSARKLEEIKLVRQRVKENTDEMKRKEQLEKQLTAEYGEMTRDVSRKSYTKRIFEIVANIRKQKGEIGRALTDMRQLQKEINQLEGRVERTFTAADDIIFKDAKNDASVRQAYKYLVSLHGNSTQLLDIVEKTGGVMREIRELEEQIATESKKSTGENLKKITADFKEMKKENSEMIKKLKSMTSSPKNRKNKT